MVGDCLSPPCVSPLDFEGVLVNLFAKADGNGCVGLKLYLENADETCVDANMCDTKLSLQQLVLRSIVEDDNGGYALRGIYVTGDKNCYPCGVFADMDEMLRSLFIKKGDCFGIKLAVGDTDCDNVTPYANCGVVPTVEQLFKNLLVQNEVYGIYMHINQLIEDCSYTLPCDLNITFQQIMNGLVNQLNGECYAIFNLNAITARSYVDLKECGDYFTFEQAFRVALTVVDCGYALNVILVSALPR